MSLKAELETWAAALAAYDAQNFEEALELFSRIADSSKIFTNIGLIYATLGDHERAVEQFLAATQLDQYLAIAYFQCGVSNFLLNRFDRALGDFDEAFLYLRGNLHIDYEQIGLKFKLYTAEILFNHGLCLIYMGRVSEGLAYMEAARKEKKTDEHSVIDEAIQDKGEGYTVFSIPVGILYRPSENKLKNAKQKDYMGKAKLVATENANEAYTTFSGVTRLRQGITPQGVFVDDLQQPPDLNRSVTVPAPRTASVAPAPAALQRSKTTGGVPSSNVGGRTRVAVPTVEPVLESIAEGSNTGRVGPSLPTTRALSIRRQKSTPDVRRLNISSPAPSRLKRDNEPSPTESFDDYIGAYRDSPRPSPRPSPPPVTSPKYSEERSVTNWTRNNTINRSLSKTVRTVTPPGVRRRPTRSNTLPRSRGIIAYDEEEGYASGDNNSAVIYELAKIRVKVHYQNEVRGMALSSDAPYEEFMDMLSGKFGVTPDMLDVKFKDEDGGKVSLKDESDYEMAMETVKEMAQGKMEGKMEIWCTDT